MSTYLLWVRRPGYLSLHQTSGAGFGTVGEPSFVPDNPGAVGSAGILTFVFRAVDKGEMVINLVYLPPGGGTTPAKTFHIDLSVR